MTEYSNSAMADLIAEWIHSERDRAVLYSRLIDGLTYERIAERHNISVSQTRRIIDKGLQKLIKHL